VGIISDDYSSEGTVHLIQQEGSPHRLDIIHCSMDLTDCHTPFSESFRRDHLILAFRTENLEMYFQIGGTAVGALRGVSLNVEEGEFVSIVGTSGSGKSTLLTLVGVY
jgi:ABC-type lipoprotein export system ATPase subunit